MPPASATKPVTTLDFPSVGPLTVYLPNKVDAATQVVLFASGDGGWNLGVVEMADRLRQQGSIVIGFSTPEYLKRIDASGERCAYPPQELEALSQFVQQTLHLDAYRIPKLIGYSSGAALVYVALAQAPINTFAGGIGLGFCPELDLTKPLCVQGALRREPDKSQQGFRLDPVADLVAPMAMLHGDMDQVCSHDAVAAFTGQVGNASMVSLPGVGHGFAVYQNWFPQMLAAYRQIDATPGPSQAAETVALNVPLIESRGSPTQGTLVVLLSGDGGWSSLTQKVTAELNRRGFPVLGWNTLKYFWNGKTPEQASADLGRVIDHYAKAWRIRDIVIGGYSMGADVLPGMVNRLGDNVRRDIRSVVLLAPGRTTDFTFHLTAWLQHTAADQPPILPDAQRLADQLALTCVYGREESDTSLCTQLEATKAIVRVLPGAHHFDGDYAGLADLIVSSMVPAN